MIMWAPYGAQIVRALRTTQANSRPVAKIVSCRENGYCVCVAAHDALVTTAAGQKRITAASAARRKPRKMNSS